MTVFDYFSENSRIISAQVLAVGNFYPYHAHTEFLDNNNLTWQQTEDYPYHEDIHYASVTFYDDNFYVFGGLSEKGLISTIARINQYSKNWEYGEVALSFLEVIFFSW